MLYVASSVILAFSLYNEVDPFFFFENEWPPIHRGWEIFGWHCQNKSLTNFVQIIDICHGVVHFPFIVCHIIITLMLMWDVLFPSYKINVAFVINLIILFLWIKYFQAKFLKCKILFYRTTLAPFDYVKVKTTRLVGLLLNIFCLRKHVIHLRDIGTEQTRTGLMGLWVNCFCQIF